MSDVADDRGESDIPWKPPVIAAVIGAFLVAAFVIYAIVTGPVVEPDSEEAIAQPVPSVELPPGFTPLSSDAEVGIRIESVTRDGGSSRVVVSSAVRGTMNPADAPPPDIAYWEIGPEGARVPMEVQFASNDAPGTTVIEFPVELAPSDEIIVAYPVSASTSVQAEIEFDPDMLGEPIPFVLEVDPEAAITGTVTVGDGWGHLEWAAPDGALATVDVEVTFVGTENPAADAFDPIRLVPTHDPALGRPGVVNTPGPLRGYGGSYGLYSDGRSLEDGIEATSILIALDANVATELGPPVVLTGQTD